MDNKLSSQQLLDKLTNDKINNYLNTINSKIDQINMKLDLMIDEQNITLGLKISVNNWKT